MTIDNGQIILYFFALIILFLTPGPVWVALIARTVSGGAKSSISLALGVSLGDMLWPFAVYFSLGILISIYSDILLIFRYFASLAAKIAFELISSKLSARPAASNINRLDA